MAPFAFQRGNMLKVLNDIIKKVFNKGVYYTTCADCGTILEIWLRYPLERTTWEEWKDMPRIILYKRKENE